MRRLPPALLASYEQLIVTNLLLSQENSYSEALRRLERGAAPRAVRRAIAFIEDHLDAPVTLADIIAASGVPGRTLLKQFEDQRGTSPMRYLRERRLERAHEPRGVGEGVRATRRLPPGAAHRGDLPPRRPG